MAGDVPGGLAVSGFKTVNDPPVARTCALRVSVAETRWPWVKLRDGVPYVPVFEMIPGRWRARLPSTPCRLRQARGQARLERR